MGSDGKREYILEEYLYGQKGTIQIVDFKDLRVEDNDEMEKILEKIPESVKRRFTEKEEEKMMEKEKIVRRIEEKATEEWKNRNLENDIVNEKKTSVIEKWKSLIQQSKELSSNSEVKQMRVRDYEYDFVDPCPLEMQKVPITELSEVSIDWKMLTVARPEKKLDELFYSQLVNLTRLSNKSRKGEEKVLKVNGGIDPDLSFKKPSESKGGVYETFIKVCELCQVERCSGACVLFDYEDHTRKVKSTEDDEDKSDAKTEKKQSKKRKKSKAKK